MRTRRSERSHAARGNFEPSALQGQKSIASPVSGTASAAPAGASGPIATLV